MSTEFTSSDDEKLMLRLITAQLNAIAKGQTIQQANDEFLAENGHLIDADETTRPVTFATFNRKVRDYRMKLFEGMPAEE